jgi:hypothetical protein
MEHGYGRLWRVESSQLLAARKAHLAYLNRRDTLRNKKDMQKSIPLDPI